MSLKKIREKYNLTQEELEKITGFDQGNISRNEKGKRAYTGWAKLFFVAFDFIECKGMGREFLEYLRRRRK